MRGGGGKRTLFPLGCCSGPRLDGSFREWSPLSSQCDAKCRAESCGSVCGSVTQPGPSLKSAQLEGSDVTIIPPEGAVEQLLNSPADSCLRY